MASEKKNNRKELLVEDRAAIQGTGSFQKKTGIKKTELSKDRDQPRLFDKSNIKEKETIRRTVEYFTDLNSRFDLQLPIYIQIHANNIYRIFSSALIAPQNGENENMFSDLQSINPTALLLSNGFIARVEEKSALLEVILTEEEVFQLEITDGVAVFRRPLPISRIKKILVENDRVRIEILNTSLSADGGIIPEKLISLFEKKHQVYNLPEVKPSFNIDLSKSKMFDKILGVFSFLANYNILLANRTNNIKTLPDHFLLAAKVINKNYNIENDNERVSNFYKILFKINEVDQPLLQWLVNRMYDGSNFTDNDIIAFADFISKQTKQEFLTESKDVFNSLMKSLERKKAIREIPNLSQNEKFYLYLFAVLRQYGNLNSEDKSISRADLSEFIFPAYGEYTFACLGYFYGYKAQRNFEEKLNIDDKVFAAVFNTEKRLNLKFRLNSALDLSLIESVYQYCFNNRLASDFIDYNRLPHVNNELYRRPQYTNNLYDFDGRVFLGKALYHVRKKSPVDQIEKLLENIQRIPSISNLGARCYRKGITLESATLTEIRVTEPKYCFYFKKIDIISAVKGNVLNADEVLSDVVFGIDEKEF